MCPNEGLAAHEWRWTLMDVENQIPCGDSKRILENFSSEWTSLDIPERPWMVGRVALPFTG